MANEFKKLHSIMMRVSISSLNKAGASAVSRVTRMVREGYNIKKKWIDDRVKQTKVRKAMNISDIIYQIKISTASIPIILFKPKQLGIRKPGQKRRKNRKAGVKVRIKKGEPSFVEQAFIANMKYGEMAFKRETEARGPVFALKAGPSVSQLFSSDQAMTALEKEATDRFAEIFLQKLEYETNKLTDSKK